MRKMQRMGLLVLGLLMVGGTVWAGHETYQGFTVVHVIVNGKPVESDVPAINFHGRTMLPVRAVAEALGVEVAWDAATSTATLSTKAGVTLSDPGAPLVEFKGTGDSVSKTMDLAVGAYVVRMTHNGEENFAVKVLAASGTLVDLPANAIGSYSGSKVVTIRTAGKYILDISADGEWSVAIAPVQ